MSKGNINDIINTKAELEQSSGLTDGKNWLRHKGQARRIDEMLLIGATKQEIAQDLIDSGLFKKTLSSAKARVQRHIDHIRKEEHKIPIEMNSNGIWSFVVRATDENISPIIMTKHNFQRDDMVVSKISSSEREVQLSEESDCEDIKI